MMSSQLFGFLPPLTTYAKSTALEPRNANQMINRLGSGHNPATQSSGDIKFHSNSGFTTMTMLHHLSEQGAIVMHSLRGDGMVSSETISRIPATLVDAESVITPCGTAGPDVTRFVINRRRRQYYHLGMLNETVIPTIVERATESIQVATVSITNDPSSLLLLPGRLGPVSAARRGDNGNNGCGEALTVQPLRYQRTWEDESEWNKESIKTDYLAEKRASNTSAFLISGLAKNLR